MMSVERILTWPEALGRHPDQKKTRAQGPRRAAGQTRSASADGLDGRAARDIEWRLDDRGIGRPSLGSQEQV